MKDILIGLALVVVLLGSCGGFVFICMVFAMAFKGEFKKAVTREWTEDDEP